MTPLDRPIKRSLTVDGTTYTVTVSPDGVHIAEKGHRRGHMVAWRQLLSGEAELVSQLNRSLASTQEPSQSPVKADDDNK
jgi:hypothetical protein